MYAVVRELRYDAAKLSGASGQLEEFQRLHASQPGYIGSLSVEAGQGRRVVVNLWQSEAQAFAGRAALEPAVRRLVEPLLAAPAQLLGAGPVVDNDLVHMHGPRKDNMTQSITEATGVAVGRVGHPATPGPEHSRLDVFIGKWINEGHTIATAEAPSVKILTSDVYEWMPGRFFILHTAYGRIGNVDVGGTEIISYNPTTKSYRSLSFDSHGNVNADELTVEGDTWTWAGETHRATAVFTDNGKTQTCRHERLDESGKWVQAMDVVLVKIE